MNYSIPLRGQPAGETTLKYLSLSWAGDHSGQCEVGKFVKCGKCGCHRCKAERERLHMHFVEFLNYRVYFILLLFNLLFPCSLV